MKKNTVIGVLGGCIGLIGLVFAWIMNNLAAFTGNASDSTFLVLFTQEFWPVLGWLAFLCLFGLIMLVYAEYKIALSALILTSLLLVGLSIYYFIKVDQFMVSVVELFHPESPVNPSYLHNIPLAFKYGLYGAVLGGVMFLVSSVMRFRENSKNV